MALTNRDRVGKALDLLKEGLYGFFEREMQAEYGARWEDVATANFHPSEQQDPNWDAHKLLMVMWDQWNVVFKKPLGHAERSLVSELRTVRNDWAHQKNFSSDDAYRALDSMHRLLTAVSASEAGEMDAQKQEVMRIRFEEQRRREERKAAAAPVVEGRPTSGLKSWREIVTPHPDVASGRYQQAEFAADLWQVYLGEGTSEYRDPVDFFRRTYVTDGLGRLLVGALRRLGGDAGDPVIQLQTNFGGGKTHSMMALFHLFSGVNTGDLAGLEPVLEEAGATPPGKVNRAVFVGNKLSPGRRHEKPDGTVVRTLWGELAWQLGGAEGYAMVREDDEHATNPGDRLRELFNRYAPCLILIDEWVAYARQLHDNGNLPAGSFDTQFTFAQALSEAAKTAHNTQLVVSIPASDIEVGGDRGRAALVRLTNAVGRIDAPWRPASAEESFEIVRRRMFQPITDPDDFASRDAVIRAFSRLYQEQQGEFPSPCRERDYERRMKASYPIHPELFDRLYEDWSSLERFQRTRGVLRLMAAVIHELWERGDSNLLILPATVPIEAPLVQSELTRYLEDNWVPVIERDVDGPNSLPLRLDRENPNMGRYSACRRVARSLFLGSAPTAKTSNPGLDDRSIRLGCVQPGESVATFGDALRRLTDKATHLYVNQGRYWFNTQPSVNRLAQDRAAQLDGDVADEELIRRLRADKQRGPFAGVHASPASSSDVPDQNEVRLVVLGPKYPHTARSDDSAARKACAEILRQRGDAPRNYPNMLVFLAPDQARLSDLREAIRTYLAWLSIWEDRVKLNLDAFSKSQAETKRDDAVKTVASRIRESYVWLLVPNQPDPKKAEVRWTETRLQGADALAVRAAKKLENDEELITKFSGTRLRMELDRYDLWRGGDHVSLKQVWEDVARYLYLSRLRDSQVVIDAAQEGISQLTWQENFAYAAAWDEASQKYLGLKAGQSGSVLMDSQSVLVKPEAARRQLDAALIPVINGDGSGGGDGDGDGGKGGDGDGGDGPPVTTGLRFHGTVHLDPTRMGRDAGQIAEAVVQHLNSIMDAEVTITLDIEARLPDGASDATIRTVTENAHTLKFDQFGFEEE